MAPDGLDAASYGAQQGLRVQEATRRFHELCTGTGGTVDICGVLGSACSIESCGRTLPDEGWSLTAYLLCRCPDGTGWDPLDGCRSCLVSYTCTEVAAQLRAVRQCVDDLDCLQWGGRTGVCECSDFLSAGGPRSVEGRYADLELAALLNAELACGLDVCGCVRRVGCVEGQCTADAR